MRLPGLYDAKSGMRYVLIGQIERIALAADETQFARGVNILAQLSAPWTREDKKYDAEVAKALDGHIDGEPLTEQQRYDMLAAIVCSLARAGMLDTLETPVDPARTLDDEEGEVPGVVDEL